MITRTDLDELAAAPPQVQLATLLRAVDVLRVSAINAASVWMVVGGAGEGVDRVLESHESTSTVRA